MGMIPNGKPRQSEEETRRILLAHGVKDKVALLGVRGYYLNSMGKKGKNDRGIYDDALFLVGPNIYASFNANVDASVNRKHMANLKLGLYRYKIGIHGLSKPPSRRYRSLVQAAQVTVVRDQEGEDTGWFGINIHRGSMNSTSSAGCQTIPPLLWDMFIASTETEMKREQQETIPYLLIDNA